MEFDFCQRILFRMKTIADQKQVTKIENPDWLPTWTGNSVVNPFLSSVYYSKRSMSVVFGENHIFQKRRIRIPLLHIQDAFTQSEYFLNRYQFHALVITFTGWRKEIMHTRTAVNIFIQTKSIRILTILCRWSRTEKTYCLFTQRKWHASVLCRWWLVNALLSTMQTAHAMWVVLQLNTHSVLHQQKSSDTQSAPNLFISCTNQ